MNAHASLLLGAWMSLAMPLCAQVPPKHDSSAACGPVTGQSFNCPKFGFAYQIPFGWINRSLEMQASGNEGETATSGVPQSPEMRASHSQLLLALFERPPEAVGETINSSVVIAAEGRASYPQVKTAADYLGAISDLAEKTGLKAAADPYAFSVGAKQLVREDFSGARGKLPIYQSSLVMIEKREIVSFTFIGGDQDEVDGLITGLHFRSARSRSGP